MGKNYLITGEEGFLVDAKLQELVQDLGQDEWARERLTSWDETNAKLLSMPMFAGPRVFILDFNILLKSQVDPEKLGELLASHDNVLIIYTKEKIDKRTRLYKEVAKNALLIELASIRGRELTRWLGKRGIELGATSFPERAAERLAFLAGPDLATLDNELKKLINYSPVVNSETVEKLAVRAPQTNIFSLIDNVVNGNVGVAMVMVEDMLRSGIQVPYLLYMLSRQYRLLFSYLFHRKRGVSPGEISKLLPPLHPYAFQILSTQAGKLSLAECADSLHSILEADYLYKNGVQRGPGLVQSLVVKLIKK